ncbi:MAG TPA: ArsR family transcriptional regulator [Firmicutes bacterium]|nr:ArsR family transcriptional regulator [Bacillota bacterium]
MPETATRIQPEEAKKAVDDGALLVSAYDGEKFEKTKIGDAIPASALQERADQLPRDREMIFY